jgi:sterol desaturase/sphingolipid hydroxylase (fatty acid hydroxylase superfamily)
MKTSELHSWSYYFDFITFPVMISITILLVFETDMPPLDLIWLLSGLALWSLFEYLFHRWGFHQFIFSHSHQLHHAYPAGYVGVPSIITSTTYVFGICLSLLIDVPVMASLFVGFSIGYFLYISVHHQIHHGRCVGRHLDSARIRHNRHHRDPRCDFGVTVSFWDRIFVTQSGVLHATPRQRRTVTLAARPNP